ncbi:hypothetical protein FRC09_010325 [Ceratobasidium sp. 395]|nr:hypothetical protein FRC09_010325 [Ceratobasidium sp. 395]
MSNKAPTSSSKAQKSTAVPVAKASNAYDRLAAAGGSIAIAGANILPSPMSSINNSVTNSSTAFWPVALRHALSRVEFGLADRVELAAR